MKHSDVSQSSKNDHQHASCCKLSIRLLDVIDAQIAETRVHRRPRMFFVYVYIEIGFCDDRSIDVQWLVAIIRLHHYPSLFRCEVWITWRDFGCPGVRRIVIS